MPSDEQSVTRKRVKTTSSAVSSCTDSKNLGEAALSDQIETRRSNDKYVRWRTNDAMSLAEAWSQSTRRGVVDDDDDAANEAATSHLSSCARDDREGSTSANADADGDETRPYEQTVDVAKVVVGLRAVLSAHRASDAATQYHDEPLRLTRVVWKQAALDHRRLRVSNPCHLETKPPDVAHQPRVVHRDDFALD